MSEKAFYRKAASEILGPGGWRCTCCTPKPGVATRKLKRIGKRKMNRLFSTLIEDELKDS